MEVLAPPKNALISQVPDELISAGALPRKRRPGLEYVAWAEIHGVATLYFDGPLARMDSAERQDIVEQALDAIIRGL
jgi:hypothetical protein